MPRSTLAERMREARRDAGLSQAELARGIAHITKAPITKSLISQWETAKVSNPQNATIAAAANVMAVSLEWLLTGKPPKKVDLPGALHAHQQAQPLDRQALAKAIHFALASKASSADRTVYVALELYDILCESPQTPDAAMTRFASSFASRDPN